MKGSRPKPPKESKAEAMIRLSRLLDQHFPEWEKQRGFLYSHFTGIDITGMADLLDTGHAAP